MAELAAEELSLTHNTSSVREALVEVATQSLQSHERLCYLINSSKHKSQGPSQHVVSECHRVLDSLRQLKSELEGNHYECCTPTPLHAPSLSRLKRLILAHTPADMSEQHKVKMADLLAEVMTGHVKTLLYACLLTCPWYAWGQDELSSKANKNVLFLVYVSLDDDFFTLATPHERGQLDSKDYGYLYACDVRHFCSELLHGNVRSIEALYSPPECLVVCSPSWLHLVGQFQHPQRLMAKSFAASCMGQAVGALASRKKGHGDAMILKAGVDLSTFSTSCRLLYYLESAVKKESLCTWTSSPDFPETANLNARKAMLLLKEGFSGLERKAQLLECLLSWKQDLCAAGLPEHTTAPESLWTPELGQWLARVRLNGVTVKTPSPMSETDELRVSELLCSLNMGKIAAIDVLMVCLAGSRLYNLSLPSSDKDYIVVFRRPTVDLVSSTTLSSESQHNRGQQQPQEAGAYEARMMCDMVLKGAVNMIELLFAEEWFYCSEEWKELVAHRHRFISEKVILQYVGYIKTHLSRIESGKHCDTPRERKIFYSIFHKLLSLESFVVGKYPIVHCSGEDRDFIMRIRTGPLEGELASEELYKLAQHRLSETRAKLRARTSRMIEYGDYKFLQTWLNSVRGIHFDKNEVAADGVKRSPDLSCD